MPKIRIRPSPTADTRTCDWSKVTRETLYQSSVQHIADVAAGMRFLAARLADAARVHDHDKLTAIDGFHADFRTGFKQTGWWDNHRKVNRHHLTSEDGIPADVNLIDVFDHIVDCVMAGMARAGSVSPLSLDADLLARAFQNTVALMVEHVEVVADPRPTAGRAPCSPVGATEAPGPGLLKSASSPAAASPSDATMQGEDLDAKLRRRYRHARASILLRKNRALRAELARERLAREQAERERDEANGLFQRTHHVHVSWVWEGEKQRLRAESSESSAQALATALRGLCECLDCLWYETDPDDVQKGAPHPWTKAARAALSAFEAGRAKGGRP